MFNSQQQGTTSDDIWLSEADGNGELATTQRLIAEREYQRLREQFQTLGMKEGASEGVDQFRQEHFEEGLKKGLLEGMMVGLLMELFSKQQRQEDQEKLELFSSSSEKVESWSQDQMNQVLDTARKSLDSHHHHDEQSKWVSEVMQQFGEEVKPWLEMKVNTQESSSSEQKE
ncbi:hypothetical protein C9374_004875 [Naegleria lovaniensis]|uniref:Essential protein Yae1 N-terminal domain-containing protein n=1 Tax=Naegleria lovaniensis TaxID=51637 RepID=A0AA88KKE7_NAELO|nr:uncharacterized protein C9374_004875 [Naegleria lovaniensis]KAG2382908.1 hypothetical protein C9374_004875 [Naegleria lovaniensis]